MVTNVLSTPECSGSSWITKVLCTIIKTIKQQISRVKQAWKKMKDILAGSHCGHSFLFYTQQKVRSRWRQIRWVFRRQSNLWPGSDRPLTRVSAAWLTNFSVTPPWLPAPDHGGLGEHSTRKLWPPGGSSLLPESRPCCRSYKVRRAWACSEIVVAFPGVVDWLNSESLLGLPVGKCVTSWNAGVLWGGH